MRTAEQAVSRVAAAHEGAFTRRQALQSGMSERTIERRVADRVFLTTPLSGVLRMAWAPETWRQQLWVAQLWAGDRAAISHDAAATLWGLDHFAPGPVHVTVPTGTNSRAAIAVHRSDLHRRDVRCIERLRVTSPERTLVDVAATTAAWMTEDAAESALYLGLTTGPRVLERIRGRPGTAALRAYLESRG